MINLTTRRIIYICAATLLLVALLLGNKCRSSFVKLNRADSLLVANPPEALELVRDINDLFLVYPSAKARYSLLHTKILDKNFIDVSTDSIIDYAQSYYSKKGTPKERAEMFYYRGILYLNMGDKDKTIECMVKAKEFAVETGDNYLKALISNTLANTYYKEGSFNEAIEEFNESGNYFGLYGDTLRNANALAYVGKCYSLLKRDSLAIVYGSRAKEGYVAVRDTAKVLMMNGFIASAYNSNGDYDIAREILVDGYNIYNNGVILTSDYALLARIELAKGECNRAYEYVKDAFNRSNLGARSWAGLYVILKEVDIAKGNYLGALENYKRFNKLLYNEYQEDKREFVDNIIVTYNKHRQQDVYNELKLKSRYTRVIYIILILVILLILGSVIIGLIRKRDRLREELERERCESELIAEEMQREIETLTTQYNTVLLEAKESGDKEEFLEAFEQRMAQLKELMEAAYTSSTHPEIFYNRFKSFVSVNQNSRDAFMDIRYLVNRRYSGIVDYVVTNHPKLTEQEVDLFSLIAFGFSSNAIRLIYGHTNLDSLFHKRKKLRAKLELTESIKLENYIKNLKIELNRGNI